MKNRTRLLRTAGAAVALAAGMLTVTATQAAAFPVWSPPLTTFTGTGQEIGFTVNASTYKCQSSMTVNTGTGTSAKTQPPAGGGVTFSNCQSSGNIGNRPTTATMTGQWTLRPATTTGVYIDVPANSLKIRWETSPTQSCEITIGAGNPVTLSASWEPNARVLQWTGSAPARMAGSGPHCYPLLTFNAYPAFNGILSGWDFPAGLSIQP